MKKLEPYQQRVIQEREELNLRLEKLKMFFDNPIFSSVNVDEQNRLKLQMGHMTNYLDVLDQRIQAMNI